MNPIFTKEHQPPPFPQGEPGFVRELKKHQVFNRLYTLVRSVLLNYFDLTSVIQSCDTIGRRGPKRIRGTPEQAYQMLFDFA